MDYEAPVFSDISLSYSPWFINVNVSCWKKTVDYCRTLRRTRHNWNRRFFVFVSSWKIRYWRTSSIRNLNCFFILFLSWTSIYVCFPMSWSGKGWLPLMKERHRSSAGYGMCYTHTQYTSPTLNLFHTGLANRKPRVLIYVMQSHGPLHCYGDLCSLWNEPPDGGSHQSYLETKFRVKES